MRVRKSFGRFAVVGFSAVLFYTVCANSSNGQVGLSRNLAAPLMPKLADLENSDKGASSDDYISSVAYSPDGKLLAAVDMNGRLTVWSLGKGQPKESATFYLNDELGGKKLLFSPDCSMLALHTEGDGELLILDLHGPKSLLLSAAKAPQPRLTLAVPGFASLAFSDDSRYLAVGSMSEEGSIRIWNLQSAQPNEERRLHDRECNGLAYTPDGKKLISKSWDGGGDRAVLRIWELTRTRPTHFDIKCPRGLVLFRANPGGKTFLEVERTPNQTDGSASSEKAKALARAGIFTVEQEITSNLTIRVRDLKDGSVISKKELARNVPTPRVLALSPDGKTLAAVDRSGMVTWWDVSSGMMSGRSGSSKTARVHCMAISPTGNAVAIGKEDGTISIIDLVHKAK